jgi:quercetin dioxygenase-like cupin family protein
VYRHIEMKEVNKVKSLRVLSVVTFLLALLVVFVASGATAASSTAGASGLGAQPAAAGPEISFQGTYPLTVDAGDYDLTYLVLDFAPGAAIPLHYHGGPALVVGMEGILTLRPEGAPEHMLMPGDVINEAAGVRHVMINTSSANTRIMAVVLLPRGGELTTVVDTGSNPPAGPTVPFQGAYPLTVAAGKYSLVNLVLDFAPGAEIPLHYHGGPALLVGMDGTLTLRPEAGAEHTVTPGMVVNEKAGARHVMINTSDVNARILAGVLLPEGAELTTVVAEPSQPAGMPKTGSGSATVRVTELAALALRLLFLGAVFLFVRSRSR